MPEYKKLEKFISEMNTSEDKKIIIEKMKLYKKILIEENTKINLISKTTVQDIDNRHFLDSLQIINLIINKNKSLADIGTGGGLPGIILAIAGCKNVSLVEKQRKKCIFLKKVNKELGLKMRIHNDRVENLLKQKFDYIVSRAFAKIDQILKTTKNISDKKTTFILLKGKTFLDEITVINKKNFNIRYIESITSKESKIVELIYK